MLKRIIFATPHPWLFSYFPGGWGWGGVPGAEAGEKHTTGCCGRGSPGQPRGVSCGGLGDVGRGLCGVRGSGRQIVVERGLGGLLPGISEDRCTLECSFAGNSSWDETQAKHQSEGPQDLFGNISQLIDKGRLGFGGEEA